MAGEAEKRRLRAIDQELALLRRREESLRRRAQRPERLTWRRDLEEKVPPQVCQALEKAFFQAFHLIFEKGTGLVERSCDRERLRDESQIRRFAFQVRGDRRSLRQIRRGAGTANRANLLLTTAEGVALGALGIGLPDVVLFLGVLLRGIYQTALLYGVDYQSPRERYFLLLLMETALKRGEDWSAGNRALEPFLDGAPREVEPEDLRAQTRRTADAFAGELLVMKFLQGLPLVGVMGGLGNPLYYHRVLRYAQIKYAQRALSALRRETEAGTREGRG